ncbi:hypothetical protein REISMN_06815 [Rickettsia tamurae subsp. buchneri]|uniref:Transmembrane protein n=1 Tax=Rickettsia tamurae subsp. buchneri TaxID=1462938 RepID=A0A8E0WKS5_9RICK|nr:hypothetical protein REIS_1156 [Rickettsia endosymbiont of Ixodes scapularis]KDO02478.1 hypothetical protein REISMN_06815 [Rickettsia tamurae subsp. buchneri]
MVKLDCFLGVSSSTFVCSGAGFEKIIGFWVSTCGDGVSTNISSAWECVVKSVCFLCASFHAFICSEVGFGGTAGFVFFGGYLTYLIFFPTLLFYLLLILEYYLVPY